MKEGKTDACLDHMIDGCDDDGLPGPVGPAVPLALSLTHPPRTFRPWARPAYYTQSMRSEFPVLPVEKRDKGARCPRRVRVVPTVPSGLDEESEREKGARERIAGRR